MSFLYLNIGDSITRIRRGSRPPVFLKEVLVGEVVNCEKIIFSR